MSCDSDLAARARNGFDFTTSRIDDDDDDDFENMDTHSQMLLEGAIHEMEASAFGDGGGRGCKLFRVTGTPYKQPGGSGNSSTDDLDGGRRQPVRYNSSCTLHGLTITSSRLVITGTATAPEAPDVSTGGPHEETFAAHGLCVEPVLVASTEARNGMRGHHRPEERLSRHLGMPPRQPPLAISEHVMHQLVERLWRAPLGALLGALPRLIARLILGLPSTASAMSRAGALAHSQQQPQPGGNQPSRAACCAPTSVSGPPTAMLSNHAVSAPAAAAAPPAAACNARPRVVQQPRAGGTSSKPLAPPKAAAGSLRARLAPTSAGGVDGTRRTKSASNGAVYEQLFEEAPRGHSATKASSAAAPGRAAAAAPRGGLPSRRVAR